MSTVTVQLGQCGNQIGAELFSTLFSEAASGPAQLRTSILETFFRAPNDSRECVARQDRFVARSVLVDMEPKVINAVTRATAEGKQPWSYDLSSAWYQQSGSGNNWARGYHTYGEHAVGCIEEVVRREVEACDYFGGFLLLQSMAGGTGAGLGTRVAEALRDEYPCSFIFNHCIWPYDTGEVIVQSYNTLLTLSHLQETSDSVLLVPNSALHATCLRSHAIARPSFQHLNLVAARELAALFLPAHLRPISNAGGGGRRPVILGDIAEHMCGLPAHRIMTLRSIPQMPMGSEDFTTFAWPALLKRLRQMLITGEQGASENNAGAAGQPAAKSGMEVLLEQQGEMMKLMMKQMETLAARVEVAEEAAAKAASQAGGSAQSGDAELEALKKLPYVPHVEGNPFPARPATLETDMPQMYDLYNDKTYDALSKRTNSSMRYEQLVLAPALSYMHDAIAFSEVTLDWCQDEKDPPTVEELSERVFAAHNTFKGVFSLLNNRYTMLQLRASMESDATSHGGAEALRAKLAFIEEKVYAGSDGLVSDSVLTKWLKEFDTTKAKAVMNTHAKASAKVSTFRDRQGGKGKGAGKGEGGRGSGKGAGANSEVMQWISKGAKMRWVDKAPLPFDHGVSLGDATPPQLEWMAAETERCLRTGAWVRARRRRHVSRVFLVPKPGTNKWRLVMDFRWLNAHCVKSRCKMETLKKLRRLAKPSDWCFSFDLQDGYHVVGIDPAFQEYMQFDVRGALFQCGALPFGWNDSPRIFVKVMKVLVECLRSPRSAEDRREVRKLQSGSKVRRRWAVRRRAGGCGREEHQQGARVLPYMDDFLLLLSSRIEALRARELTSQVLVRLGLSRNEKKGQWEPTQLVEHLGLEVDLKAGQFRVTPARLQKIHLQSKALLSEASRQRRWLPARKLAAFTGLCQSVYLAVPPARLYLRELHFVLSTRRGWGAKVKLTRQAWSDIEWWLRLPAQSRWNGRKIWRSPTRAKVHTDASLFAWGGVLNLKHAARGFWSDELRHLHITHLELEAVYKTVQSFLRELTGKVVRLYCDNQAVVAMLSHFTSRNPELMRRMRRLWILLDLNDIELQARYIRSEANEWGERLSRDRDLDDWRLNRRWFQWAEREWHRHTVDRFASELSAQLPRYYAQWHDPGCEGVDSLAFSWLGEVNWVNPPWSLLDEVAHKLREEKCAATVVAPYWPGQMWFQQLEAMADEVVILPRGRDLFTPSRLGGSELLGASSWDGIMFRISASR
ncbi:hypothetical protein CYMTET_51557 [Cymbomonas tetramitiformis]|uniref:Tubulin delta chain n=1 Tax=Cymbomonas tetramitiformis TaxID=36881 RepID=A0AAE0BMP5_9CHLO|nr:hypothetical protein CYMTET_51557 [Cymbomonas tetramitiformis]